MSTYIMADGFFAQLAIEITNRAANRYHVGRMLLDIWAGAHGMPSTDEREVFQRVSAKVEELRHANYTISELYNKEFVEMGHVEYKLGYHSYKWSDTQLLKYMTCLVYQLCPHKMLTVDETTETVCEQFSLLTTEFALELLKSTVEYKEARWDWSED